MKPSPPLSKHQGFALVITLALMILLVVLSVGLLGLSSIEIRNGSAGSARLQAEANARLALQMAIGQLQVEMGPDQRITAPGGQQIAGAGSRSHWTGVYDSWKQTEKTRPETAKFRRWLISGNESVVTNREAAKGTTPLAERTAILVGGNREGTLGGAHEPVEAGLVDVPSGAYAWWIGDNSMKAKLGDTLPASSTSTRVLANLQCAPRANPAPLIESGPAPADSSWNTLISLKTAELFGKPSEALFHDATSVSSGLITNVRRGGFRRDLSFLMERPLAEMETTPLYTAGNTNGLSLRELWSAHQIWGEILTSGLSAHADGGAMPAGTPYLTPPASHTAAIADPFLGYRQLTKIQFTTLFSLITERSGGAVPTYKLFLVVDPIYTIWNPFDVSISIPASAFTAIKNWSIPYNLKLNIRTPTGTKVITGKIQDAVDNYTLGALGRNQSLILRPGEVQVLSQTHNGTITNINAGGGLGAIDAKLGFNFGAGYKFDLGAKFGADLQTLPSGTSISYEMTPNSSNAVHGYALISSGHSIQSGGNAAPIGSFGVDVSKASGTRINATQYPLVFPTLPDTGLSKTVNELAVTSPSEKWPICVYTVGVRTETDNLFVASGERRTGKFLLRNNPKAYALELPDLTPDFLRALPLQIGIRRVNDLASGGIAECDAKGLGYFGGGYESFTGVSYLVTHSVPTAPIHSLGALQHAIVALPGGMVPGEGMQQLLPFVSHAISNSFAPSIMSSSATTGTIGAGTKVKNTADHSYLLNLALWDDYFYSSVSPTTTSAAKNANQAGSEQKEVLRKFLEANGNGTDALPNSRFHPFTTNTGQILGELFQGTKPAAAAAERMASHLYVDGAFNVNSTSVPAWKSFLSSLKDSPVPVREARNPQKTPVETTPSGTPVIAGMVAAGNEINAGELSDPKSAAQWTGFRSLTDPQIQELAEAVVKQVRLRGPFISLADFVNRRPGADKDLALAGALQCALDDPSVSINAGYRSSARSLGSTETAGYAFPEAEEGAKAVGAPGYIKQADLLTALAPMVTVRGDTFTIRGYGESRAADGKVLARVVCEAMVQRQPEYVDATEPAYVAIPKNTSNQQLGRRFEVISFRYLNPDELREY